MSTTSAVSSDQDDWVCCFCGNSVSSKVGVRLLIATEEMEEAEQQFLAHKECFAKVLHPSVPLHPDVSES